MRCSARRIQDQVADTKNILFIKSASGSPEDGADARDKLTRRAGLGDIIVGAEVKAGNPVDVVPFRREHQDGNIAKAADTLQRIDAVHSRHHDVENDDVDRLVGGTGDADPGVNRCFNVESLFHEIFAEKRRQLDIIVDEKNFRHLGFHVVRDKRIYRRWRTGRSFTQLYTSLTALNIAVAIRRSVGNCLGASLTKMTIAQARFLWPSVRENAPPRSNGAFPANRYFNVARHHRLWAGLNGAPRQLCALLLVAGGLSGCVVGPDYQKPSFPMAASWSGKAAVHADKPPQLAEWWKQMKDPILDDLIAQAVAANLDVATAKAKVREARASYREQVGTLLPTVEGTASATRNRTAAAAGAPATIYNNYQPGFDASWELDLFGGNKRAAEAAKYGVDAADEELRDTLVTLIGDVATYYIQAREYQQLTELARDSSKSQSQTASLTRTEYGAGGSSMVDVSKAEAQAASTHADIPTYEISYAKSVNRLGVLLGKSPLLLDGLLGKKSRLPAPPPRLSVGIPADILNTRPDVRQAERQLAQATAKIGEAEANRYPSVSLTGSINSSAASVSELGKKSTIGWSFGPSLTIPIFKGGQLKAAVDVAKAQRDQYVFAYQSAVLSALEDVQNAIVSLNRSRARSVDLGKAVEGYRTAANLSKKLKTSGEGDLFDVLDAERSLYSAQQNLIETRTDIATYYVSLNKALGGGWTGPIDISQPAARDLVEAPHLRAKPIAQ